MSPVSNLKAPPHPVGRSCRSAISLGDGTVALPGTTGNQLRLGWGISWQITPRVLMDGLAAGGAEAKRVFAAMMDMGKIDVAKIEAARRG